MQLTKKDLYDAIKRLGPHACSEFIVNPTDEIYKYFNEDVELDKIKDYNLVEFNLSTHNATLTAKKMDRNTMYLMIHKKPEGFLGFY